MKECDQRRERRVEGVGRGEREEGEDEREERETHANSTDHASCAPAIPTVILTKSALLNVVFFLFPPSSFPPACPPLPPSPGTSALAPSSSVKRNGAGKAATPSTPIEDEESPTPRVSFALDLASLRFERGVEAAGGAVGEGVAVEKDWYVR